MSGEGSRRGFLKLAATAAAVGAAAGVGGYLSGVAAAPPPKTVTEKTAITLASETVTKTVTPPSSQFPSDILYNPTRQFLYHTHFESIRHWKVYSVNSVETINERGLLLKTGNKPEDFNLISYYPFYAIIPLTWDKKRILKVGLNTRYYQTEKQASVCMGSYADEVHLGFKIENGKLYGSSTSPPDGTPSTMVELLPRIAPDKYYIWEVRYNPAIPKAWFLVNGELKGTITTNLPKGKTRAAQVTIFNKTLTADARYLWITELLWWQEGS